MNDSMSILLATTVLALGGLGLYMFKSEKTTKTDKAHKKHTDDEDDYDEDGLFGGSTLFNWGSSEDEHKDDETVDHDIIEDFEEDYEEEYKPRKRGAKTQKNRKPTGSSRRRY